jgi:ketosteroid isomerase-like protein
MTTAPETAHTPEAILALFSQAMNRGDLDFILTLYEDNACLIPQPHQQPVHGKPAIRQTLQDFLALKAKIEIQRTTSVRAGDIALLRSAWRLTGTGPDGSALQMAHESTDVARRQPDGCWRIVIDHPFGADPA